MTVESLPLKRYEVTRTETVMVEARNEEQAEFLGIEKLNFVGNETYNVQVEEVE